MGHGRQPSRGTSNPFYSNLIHTLLTHLHFQTYGVVPQAIYPESYHSSASSPLNTLLKTKLREHALILRSLASSLRASSGSPSAELTDTHIRILRAKKEELLKEVYTIMSAILGVPPLPTSGSGKDNNRFVWEYYDKDGKAGRWEGTPKELYDIAKGDYSVGYMRLFHPSLRGLY